MAKQCNAKKQPAKASGPEKKYAYSIYEPIDGHLSGKGTLAFCESAVKAAYPDAKFVAEPATGRVLGQVQGGSIAVITLLS